MFDFAQTEGILDNVMQLNINESNVKDAKYSSVLFQVNWHQFPEKSNLIIDTRLTVSKKKEKKSDCIKIIQSASIDFFRINFSVIFIVYYLVTHIH